MKYEFYIFAYWHDPNWKKFVGASVKVWDLAKNLSSHGHKVTIFLPKYNFEKINIPFKVVEIPVFDLPFLRLISYNIFLLMSLFVRFVKETPEIIYVRRMTSIVPLIFAKFMKAKFFYEINDDPYPDNKYGEKVKKNNIRSLLSAKIDEINLIFCTKSFVISQSVKEKILSKNPKLLAKKLCIFPSGSNTILYRPLNKNDYKLSLNFNLEKRYVGFIGSLLPHQGIDTLIDAAPEILKLQPNIAFLILGEGPMKKVWEKRVDIKSLGKAFKFIGQIKYEEIPNWLAAMDICVAPYNRSAGLRSPVKIFDYMACGKPIIASKIKGTTDIFSKSGAIKLIKPEDPQILANAIIELLSQTKKMKLMEIKGRQFILNNYDRRVMTNSIVNNAIL